MSKQEQILAKKQEQVLENFDAGNPILDVVASESIKLLFSAFSNWIASLAAKSFHKNERITALESTMVSVLKINTTQEDEIKDLREANRKQAEEIKAMKEQIEGLQILNRLRS